MPGRAASSAGELRGQPLRAWIGTLGEGLYSPEFSADRSEFSGWVDTPERIYPWPPVDPPAHELEGKPVEPRSADEPVRAACRERNLRVVPGGYLGRVVCVAEGAEPIEGLERFRTTEWKLEKISGVDEAHVMAAFGAGNVSVFWVPADMLREASLAS